MPELPEVETYLACLRPRVLGQPLQKIRMKSMFLLRSVEPPLSAAEGKRVVDLRRIGKRIVWGVEDDLYLVFHLMVSGRFRWREAGAKLPGKMGLCAFDFPDGTLLLTEASTKKRASLHVVRGEAALKEHDPGGLEVLGASLLEFKEALTRRNHTLKRGLTNPAQLSGIGGAWSDEIMHRARLSPLKHTDKLTDAEIEVLYEAARAILTDWTARLIEEAGDDFPEKVTAFKEGMAVHGKYRQPCPVCGSTVQRIVYAEHETNYCATCQTGGKVLADRALSQLLKKDWPRTLEEWERIRKPS